MSALSWWVDVLDMPDTSPSSDFSTFECWSSGISVHNWLRTSTLFMWFEPYQIQETLALVVTWEWEMKWRRNVVESKDSIMHTILWNYEAALLLPGFFFSSMSTQFFITPSGQRQTKYMVLKPCAIFLSTTIPTPNQINFYHCVVEPVSIPLNCTLELPPQWTQGSTGAWLLTYPTKPLGIREGLAYVAAANTLHSGRLSSGMLPQTSLFNSGVTTLSHSYAKE